ncbi:amidase [Mesorhizobium sp. LHD-90]|uniref:amidase n=1 Tax=Mesorhizobium sp. LHD-90 TaxID=3071414 RepID=UPI0027E15466|nr:amidase [Mesorhizobium sp. LHD-90]MDQ6438074.1 amidase [Mesorhizobium sp. LHD-90]
MSITDELHFRDLTDVAAMLRDGDVTSRELTEACLARITAVGERYNAFITMLADEALAAAKAADKARGEGRLLGPLHGVPIALKDMLDLKGVPTTAGMPMRRDHVASEDATVVRKLKDAGAVILGKLNLAEGVFGEYLEPYGAPVNPWNGERWPGASSGGNGVAMAARLCFGSIGSDTGGSIRLPSAANGITGLRPTWGRVSRHGAFELAGDMDTIGPMARSARDVAHLLQVIAGDDPLDSTSLSAPVPNYTENLTNDLTGVVVGVDPSWMDDGVEKPIVDGIDNALSTLRGLGATIREISLPPVEQIIWDWFKICAAQTALVHEDTYPSQAQHYSRSLAVHLDLGLGLRAIELQRLQKRRAVFSGQMQRALRAVDIVALPVIAFAIPTRERMLTMDEDIIYGIHRFTCPFSMSGNPTITLPVGIDADGMPLSVQFVGSWLAEATLISATHAYQSVTEHHRRCFAQ